MRLLRADEIEVRVGGVYQKGVQMLLYKNARTDMAILDEIYGEMNWQKDYKEIKGNLYCGIGVYDEEKGEWIWKWDCGTESNTEKEKGEASDAMKRASVNWQIGRELYNSPFIFLPVATVKKQNGYGYELHDRNELKGIYVSRIVSKEVNGIPTVLEVELKQKKQLIGIFRKEIEE